MIYKIQANDSIKYGYFCMGIFDFMLKSKIVKLCNFILSYRMWKKWFINTKIFSITKKINMKKVYCAICGKYRKFKNIKILDISEITLVLSIICNKFGNDNEKTFEEE